MPARVASGSAAQFDPAATVEQAVVPVRASVGRRATAATGTAG
jgi:hypothetical protein